MIVPVHVAFWLTLKEQCKSLQKKLCKPELIHSFRVGMFVQSLEFQTPLELKVFVH